MSKREKNPNAVALGRLGGSKKTPKGFSRTDPSKARNIQSAGGRASSNRLTPAERSERARKAAAARWQNTP